MLQQAEVVAMTGTVFLTHTLDQVLAHINRNAYTLMVGPTTRMGPAFCHRHEGGARCVTCLTTVQGDRYFVDRGKEVAGGSVVDVEEVAGDSVVV